MDIEIGQKYGRLTAVEFVRQDDKWRKYYLFSCSCGTEKELHGAVVESGNTSSCGCLSRDNHRKRQLKAQETKQGAKTAIYLQYKRHAKDRGIEFSLSKDDLIGISQNNCAYCGIPPSNLKKTKNDRIGFKYNGIDRADNSKGYYIKNSVPCCKICNYAKSNLSMSEFKTWATRLGKKAMAEQWS